MSPGRLRRYRLRSLLLPAALLASSAFAAEQAPRDLYFSEAVYWAKQGLYFDALERLDAELIQHHGLDEPELDSLYPFIDDAEFSVGDFELSYRMHHRAGRAITAVLEGNVPEPVKNDAAYRLARIHFQKGQLVDALKALDRIQGRVPEEIREEVEFLRANVYLSTARPDEAVPILRRLQGSKPWVGFADYNLGIANLQQERHDAALQQLQKAGLVKGSDESVLAIRDKANLVRGTLLLEAGRFDEAKLSLERVRLEGPFSNQALLSAGWADFSDNRFDRALAPWNLLVSRNHTDPAVQEAMLALPYAYGQLNVYGRAAVLYGEALRTFGEELNRLDASIDSIQRGGFLKALVREEIRKDRDWVIRLRSLPETPETYYLMELMASHDFQTALSNYLDMEDLRRRLESWQVSFDAYEDVIAARRAYYEPLLPGLDQQFREVDSRRRLRLEQHRILADRMQNLLVAPRPEHLATTEERLLTARLNRLGEGLDPVEDAALLTRIGRLKGLVTWDVKTQYHERLTRFYEHIEASREALAVLDAQYNAYVRVRQAATHSFEGYDVPIKRLRTRVAGATQRIDLLMARQGHLLEQVAVRELKRRVERLEGYEERARYALADSYDRATAAQAALGTAEALNDGVDTPHDGAAAPRSGGE
ncbi:MAG: tetratricopeptide repeat protein [Pseudomonadales bacterium]